MGVIFDLVVHPCSPLYAGDGEQAAFVQMDGRPSLSVAEGGGGAVANLVFPVDTKIDLGGVITGRRYRIKLEEVD